MLNQAWNLNPQESAAPVVLVDHQRVGSPARWEGVGHQAAAGHQGGGHGGRNRGQRDDGRPADTTVVAQARVQTGASQWDGGEQVDHVLRQPPAVPCGHQERLAARKHFFHGGQRPWDGQLQAGHRVWNLGEDVKEVRWRSTGKMERGLRKLWW